MPWQALVWLLGFILQSGILGVSMYQLVQLTDLEADFINPHEASKNYNRLVVPEFAAQAALTGMMIFTGNWVSGILQLAALAYNIQQYQLNRHLVDVTEVFREIKPRKKALTAKLIFNLLLFIWTVYRFIEILVLSLVTPSGKAAARSIIREAAASLHRRLCRM